MKKKILALALSVSMAAMAFSGCGSASGSAKYHVGVIQLVQHPALDAATEGFEKALKDEFGDEVEIDVQNAAGDSATCATIANGFVTEGDNLIMANATPALQAAVQATATIPILGTSVTDYGTALEMDDFSGKTGINVSGTSDLAPLDQQAKMISELFPVADHKNVGVLYCTAEANSLYQFKVIKKELEDLGYTVTGYTFSDSNDVATVTQSACSDSQVIYIPTDNTAASCAATIAPIASSANVPIFTGEEGPCKVCGVATLSISYYDLGYATGQMAVEILKNGGDPAEMDIQYAPKFTKEYNKANAEALGITIPDDYTELDTSEE